MLSITLIALVTVGLLAREPMLLAVAFLFFIPAAVIAWRIALTMRGIFLELSVTGIRAAGYEIPWRNLANYRVLKESTDKFRTLTLELNEPLPARGWKQRLNSFLSRGASDREISISLLYSEEKSEIIDEAMHDHWRGAVGDDITFAAAGRQIARYQRELRGLEFSKLPAREKRRIIIGATVFFLLLGLCCHGVVVPFWSSPGWSRVSGWVAAGVTALGLFVLLRRRGITSLSNQQSTLAYFVMFLFVFAFLASCMWLIVGRSLADIATRLTGTPRESIETMRKGFNARSKSCDQFVTGESIEQRFPSSYCPDSDEYARLPDAGPMRVVARESWFGVHIDRIEPVDLK